MNERRSPGLKVWTPLLFSVIMVFGMVLGFNLRDSLRSKRSIQAIIERNDRLEQLIDLINERYVDSVNTNVLYEDAIDGILKHLDPHTVYISADELQAVNEDLEGSFSGIGVEFSIVRDTIQVTSVVEDGPAEAAGVEIGDQLIKVQDIVVAGAGITSDSIVHMLRGKEHSQVAVTLRSSMTGNEKQTVIERGSIPLYSVEASILLDQQTAYIKINRFSATTYEEFAKALRSLKAQGAKSLILDVRQNPGGYLEAATMIADEFLDDEKLIVYTQGRKSARTEYKASKPGMFETGALVILVDEGSASASEILAGAVQDWDRGAIIGRRTYGKGLVQEQYEMEDGAALRLTIAKYYTPSGRSIQRSYVNGKEAYAHDVADRFGSGELTGADTLAIADTFKYYTSQSRTVYGGGGIMPDIHVPYDTAKLNRELLNVLFSGTFRNMLWDYFVKNNADLRQYKTVAEFSRTFSTDDLFSDVFRNTPKEQKARFNQVLSNPESRAYLETQLKAQLARFLFRNNGYYVIQTSGDPVVQKALSTLRSGKYSTLIKR